MLKFLVRMRWVVLFAMISIILPGCSVAIYKGLKGDRAKIAELNQEVERLRTLRDQDQREMMTTKEALERGLGKEMGANQAHVELSEKGLVVVLSNEILFDSGKADLNSQGEEVLGHVIPIITHEAKDRQIAVEGHTDNEPIKVSSWKSNWELSTARATNVLHYLEDHGVKSSRLQATGFGEYKPVASNDTVEGQDKNRRVEIVLLPKLSEEERRILKEADEEDRAAEKDKNTK